MKLPRVLAAASAAFFVVAAASAASAIEVDIDAASPTGTDLSLGAGTYDVSEIAGTFVSANLWFESNGSNGLVGANGTVTTGCSTTSTCVFGFRPTFNISINGDPATTYQIPVAANTYPATYNNAANALAAFQAYQAANPISFTLTGPSTVNFVVPDTFYGDNSGGVSLSVVSAAPEPATWMLMIGGIGGIGFMLRRGKKYADASLDAGVAV